jgi:hypothetical protein
MDSGKFTPLRSENNSGLQPLKVRQDLSPQALKIPVVISHVNDGFIV